MKRLLLINLVIGSLYAMQPSDYIYRQATAADVGKLLKLVTVQEVSDRDKLVILPRLFRESYFKKLVDNKRLFVAQKANGELVSCKKLFFVDDESERHELLHEELRCVGEPIYAASVVVKDGKPVLTPCDLGTITDYGACIYGGSAFTLPAYRGQGINTRLTAVAFSSIKPAIVECLKKQKETPMLSLLYGIVRANAGKEPGSKGDRTIPESMQFFSFIRSIGPGAEPMVLSHRRFSAFMPTFDPEATECKPLADEHSISGYGCALTYAFRRQDEQHKDA